MVAQMAGVGRPLGLYVRADRRRACSQGAEDQAMCVECDIDLYDASMPLEVIGCGTQIC
jgi:hypothetical protein